VSYNVADENQKGAMGNQPLYTIGIVSDLLQIHRETIRVWERFGLIKPKRRSTKRFFSDDDVKRMRFIQRLMNDGLNVPGISYFLRLYPCWQPGDCPVCMKQSHETGCAKPCWKEENMFCYVSIDENACAECLHRLTESTQCSSGRPSRAAMAPENLDGKTNQRVLS
jgi:MerR family transcriptional regulator, heat shock protein HspR